VISLTALDVESLSPQVEQQIHVNAPLEVTFAALLDQLGPLNETADGKPMPLELEPWPGGRWFRDLGEGNGHFWRFRFRQAGDRAPTSHPRF
jgi:hypothetical protein